MDVEYVAESRTGAYFWLLERHSLQEKGLTNPHSFRGKILLVILPPFTPSES